MKTNIKTILESDLTSLIQDLIRVEEKKYFQYYIGKVISNKDPEKLGRCQILVYGMFDDIPVKDLPWAIPEFNFVGSEVGSFIVPPENAIVNIRFSNGNLYEPIYTTKCLMQSKLPKNKDKNYPNNLIFFETKNGDYFEINTFTKEVEFRSSHGNIISIDSIGNILVDGILKVTVKAPIIDFPHTTTGAVTPNPTGGPFNCLPYDPITGAVHQGTILTNT